MSKAAELAALIGSQTALSNRNLIINGAMQVAQRGTSGINSAAGGGICTDRHKGFSNGGGVFSMEQSSTVPNNEFAYSSKLTVTTADSSIASADYYSFQQTIEGYNIIQTGYGTSDAKRLTLSFWVRSSVTGKYSVTCFNNGGTEGYLNTFNISSADTWQKVELSWVGRTSGTWLKTNGAGMIIRFDLGGGSSGHGTADQWTTTSGYGNTRTADSVDWIATNGATFYMTGVQLEIGEQATPFEHSSYGDELARCQRYYQIIPSAGSYAFPLVRHQSGTNLNSGSVYYPVTMRANATLTLDSSGSWIHKPNIRNDSGSASLVSSSPSLFTLLATPSTNDTANYLAYSNNNVEADAEL